MKIDFRLALLSSALASVTVSAFAADLPARKAAVPPPVLATSMWDGFYMGINGGYGWTRSNRVVGTAIPGAAVTIDGIPSLTAATLASPAIPLGSAGGFLAGAQTGYNKQFGSILLGWESDIVFFGGRGKSAGAITSVFDPTPGLPAIIQPLTQAINVSAQTNWLTTTRLRVGFVATPSFLLYGTAGVAAGGVRATTAITQSYAAAFLQPGGGFGSYSSTRIGYAVGGGAEWMFAPKWSLRAEYLYYDLGRASYGVTPVTTGRDPFFLNLVSQAFPSSSVRFNGQMFRLGLNYFWDWRSLAPAPAPSPEFVAWNGFYIGANVGYGWSGSNGVNVSSTPGGTSVGAPNPSWLASAVTMASLPKASSNGFLGGGQIGTQAQFGSFVAGWEIDIQSMGAGSGRSSTGSVSEDRVGFPGFPLVGTISATNKVDWLSTSRARLGYLMTPSVLVYGTAGFAMGGVKSTTATSIAWTNAGFTSGYGYGVYSQARFGYSFGAGAEWAISPNWSLKAEYLYYDLGRANYMATPVTSLFPGTAVAAGQAYTSASTRFNGSLVRAGLNYHWNWDQPAAVVAKY